jgi:protein TonB
MPSDLFGDVVVRPPSVRSRRPSVVVASMAVHIVVVLLLLVASAVAPDILPAPRQALAYYETARLIDIELPPPPPRPRTATESPAVPPVSADAAPVEPPTGIAPETPVDATDPARIPGLVGLVSGIGTMETVGRVEAPPLPPTTATPPARLHSGMTAPRKIVDVMPVYPEVARRGRVEGLVIIEAVIDASGQVESARVLRSLRLLDQAALDAVRRWRFTPALLNGEPIPVVMTVTVNFRLQ